MSQNPFANPLYGFNFQWIYTWSEGATPRPPDHRVLDFLAEHGFNFVRIPCDYRWWTPRHDYFHPDEAVFSHLDGYLTACREFGIHMSLNLHRAPGYCINGNNLEIHNLWRDDVAQDAFEFQWRLFAERYREIPASDLSFDLLNEPPNVGQFGLTREIHEKLMRRVIAAIHEVDPKRPIVIDGLGGGHQAVPELADTGVVESSRGYMPISVSHFEAEWWDGAKDLPAPVYPGGEWEGITWDRDALVEFYRPWRDLQLQGVPVHVGEFGCFSRTPQDVAMRWLRDLFSIYREYGWGFGMWGFEGPFGIIDHKRPGAQYELYKGYLVDREMLDLMLESVAQTSAC